MTNNSGGIQALHSVDTVKIGAIFMVSWHILRQRTEEKVFSILHVTKIYCVEAKAQALKKLRNIKTYKTMVQFSA